LEDILTEKGKEDSRAFGQQVKFERLGARHSGTNRTKETIDEIYSTAPSQVRFSTRVKKPLHFNNYFSSEYLEKIRGLILEGKREEAALYQLNHETDRPDSGTASARETAAAVATLLKHYLGMEKHFKPDTKLAILNVSHDFVLTPFIAEVLRKISEKEGEQVSLKEAIAMTGGSLRPLEEIRFSMVEDESKKSLKVFFRGEEYPLDRKLIDEISDYEQPEEK